MSRFVFFDTNVLVYTDDNSAPHKKDRATSLFAEHLRKETATVSLQVLQEYFVAATRKLGVPVEAAQRKVEIIARARVVRLLAADVIAAIELHRLSKISFWDGLIVQAARSAGALRLYSEDMGSGTVIGGVRVENPFL
jgi:predicted nucleic acid-binding protein